MLESLPSEIAELLADPAAVHINMLRGTIAKPSIRAMIHLYGESAVRAELPADDRWPEHPTPEMIAAAWRVIRRGRPQGQIFTWGPGDGVREIYAAMRSARP